MLKSIIFNQHQVNHALKNKEGMFRVVVDTKQSFVEPSQPYGKLPYQVGEEIFVKESFWQFGGYDSGYDCDEPKFIGSNKITFSEEEATKTQTLNKAWKKRPAQHLKQEHSRLTIRIKGVKVERLADISNEDCWKEGCEEFADYQDKIKVCEMTKILNECVEDPRPHFAVYWNSTHKKPEEKWEANPWVWCFNYEVINNA